MIENDNHEQQSIDSTLICLVENSQSPVNYPINAEQLRQLFHKQAVNDSSEDEPELLPNSKFEINPEGLTIDSLYTISDLKGGRINLSIGGTITNDETGYLSNKTPAEIIGANGSKERVLAAFGVDKELPLKTYLKAMIEDSLQGKVNVNEMSSRQNHLFLNISKANLI